MWKYDFVTEQELEDVMKKVEGFIAAVGGKEVEADFNYKLRRPLQKVFEYNGRYYGVDSIRFDTKPFIVIECGTYDELLNNIMEDADPFPYDLTDDQLQKEVKLSLGIES